VTDSKPYGVDPWAKCAEILLSSQVAEAEIYQEITQRLRWQVPVHALYGAARPAPD
jgi:hypothetical protein